MVWREAEQKEGGLIAAYEMIAAKTAAERLLFIHADLPFLGQEERLIRRYCDRNDREIEHRQDEDETVRSNIRFFLIGC